MLPAIERLQQDVDRTWSRTGYDQTCFHELAGELLSKPLDLDLHSLARAVCSGMHLPEQRRMDLGFGQPEITLYHGPRFLIEALCWHTSTPAIHHHSFSGAFRVLTGRSVHSRYSFVESGRLGRLSMGTLQLENAEVLRSGATIAIPQGPQLIHANFHLDSPTLTMVVRTHQSPEPELTYLPPGLAYDSADRSPALHKRAQLLDTLHQVASLDYEECVRMAVRNVDPYDAMTIVMRAGARVSDGFFGELTAYLCHSFGNGAAVLASALAEERRRGVIVRLRSAVVDPDLRFFLAGLLSFSDRCALQHMMLQYYRDPAVVQELVGRGVADLLGGDSDRRVISAAAAQAMLNSVSALEFPQWASKLWCRSLTGDEAAVLGNYYQRVLDHPLLRPLAA